MLSSSNTKTKKLVTSSLVRKSISKTSKRDSSTFNVNTLLKKAVVHPTKSKKRKSLQLESLHEAIDGEGTGSTTFPKPSNKYPCNFCDKTYFFKTTLVAHQKSHTAINSCQYCQRTFALSTALSQHLREHCNKIPIAERKKLLVDDEKTSNLKKTVHKTSDLKVRYTTDELFDLVSKSCSLADGNRLKAPMECFPSIKGVYQTPRKLIKCIHCGEKFKNPALFAIHAEVCTVKE